jgi:hypothetical protein
VYLGVNLGSVRLGLSNIIHIQRILRPNITATAAISTRRTPGLWHSDMIPFFILKGHVQRRLIKMLMQVLDVEGSKPLSHSFSFSQWGMRVRVWVWRWHEHVSNVSPVRFQHVFDVTHESRWPIWFLVHRGLSIETNTGIDKRSASEPATL